MVCVSEVFIGFMALDFIGICNSLLSFSETFVKKHCVELYFVKVHCILLISSDVIPMKKSRDFLIKIWLYTINFYLCRINFLRVVCYEQETFCYCF